MKRSTSQKKITGSDGSDGQIEVPQNCALSDTASGPQNISVPAADAAIDPIVEEHGTLFATDGETTTANQIAIAAKVSRDHLIRFDADSGKFLKYSTRGIWEEIKEPAVKVLVAKFVKSEAEKSNAADFIPRRTNAFLSAVL